MSHRILARLVLALVCGGAPVQLLAQPAAPAAEPGKRDVPVEREEPPRATGLATEHQPVRHRSGARVRVGGDVTVAEGEHVGDVVAVFGRVEVNGTAHGDVVAVFGDVAVGPRGAVRGDITAVGGRVLGAEGASIYGTLTQFGWSMPDLRFTFGDRDMTTVEVVPDWPRIARVQWWLAFGGAACLAVLCALAVMLAPRAVEASIAGSRPMLVAWVVGLLVQVLGLPLLGAVAVALVASVIGIPLIAGIPFVLLALAVMSVVGGAAFSVRVGYRLLPSSFRSGPSLVSLVAGFLVLAGPGVVGSYLWWASGGTSVLSLALILLGVFIEYTWWTIGLGAGILAWLQTRRGAPPARAAAPAAPIDHMPMPSQV